MWHLWLVLVSCCCFSGAIGAAVSVVEGESVTIDCGFQTTVNGGNLLWQVTSNGSEIPLGFIVPGDHFCGIDTIECIVHTNGSITLFNVALSDGEKYYRCLRGDREGYHYFSDVNFTVVSKESLGHPVIQPLTESKANVYMIEEKGMIHSYEQPACDDKEDGGLIVTCFPPSGLIVDKVYHQVHCNCTDSDGNTYSLNFTVNSYTELKINTTSVAVIVVIIIMCVTIVGLVCTVIWCIYQWCKVKKSRNPENIDVCCLPHLGKGGSKHDEEGRELNEDTDDVSQRLNDKEAECDEIAKLKEENQKKDTEISDLRQRLTEKETECADKSKEIDKLKMDEEKDTEISDQRRRLTEKEFECTDKSKEINKHKMDKEKMRDYHRLYELIQRLPKRETEFEAVLNMIPMALKQQLRKHLLSQDKKEKKKAGGEDKDDAKPKEVTAIDQVKACEDDVIS